MNTITDYLTRDHRRCDIFFIEAENCVSSGIWDKAQASFQQFSKVIQQHFEMEEKVLFPAFEKATESSNGPTSVMRNEHQQLRGIIARLQESLVAQERDDFLGHSETLNIMLQQHNLKEENILYPMTDRIMSGNQNEVIGAMHKMEAEA